MRSLRRTEDHGSRFHALLALLCALTLASCETSSATTGDGPTAVDGPSLSDGPGPVDGGPNAVPGWAISGSGADGDGATTLALDGQGNIIVTGDFYGTVMLGNTPLTAQGPDGGVFVAKVDPTGTFLWAVALPGVCGYHDFTASGGQAKTIGFRNGLAVDGAGQVLVAAPFKGTATFGASTLTAEGDMDLFVAQLSPQGESLWAVRLGGPGYDAVSDLVVDADGAITVAGLFSDTATFGSTSLEASGTNDAFVAHLDPSGQVLWVVQGGSSAKTAFPSFEVEYGAALSIDSTGNAYVAGSVLDNATLGDVTLGSAGAFAGKIDPAGDVLWAVSLDQQTALGITRGGSGNLYLTGSTLAADGDDPYVAKLDPSGAVLWTAVAQGTVGGGGSAIVVDGDGIASVTGAFMGTASFGATTLVARGALDAFVARVDGEGRWTWAVQGGGPAMDGAGDIAMDSAGQLTIAGWFAATARFGTSTLTAQGGLDLLLWRLEPP